MAETIGTAKIIIVADGSAVEVEIRRSLDKVVPVAEKGGAKSGKAFGKGFSDGHEKEHRRWRDRIRSGLDETTGWFQRAGDKAGRAFGKGSRNDALNLFGSIIGGSVRAGGAVSALLSKITSLGDGMRKAGKDGGGGGGIGAVIGAMGKGIGGLAVAAGIIKIITSSLGVLGAAASLTTALVLALAGSLGFALVGGLVAVGGALVPFAAALGVAALALSGLMSKGSDLEKFKKDWDNLKNSVREDVFGKGGKGLGTLRGLLKAVEPLIHSVAKALGGLFKEFSAFSKSKGFSQGIEDMGKKLAPMVTTLGHIAGNIGKFLGEAFTAASPHIQEFLGWLDKVTKGWVDFGKQGKGGGKSPLAKLFDDGVASAKIVWKLLSDIGLVILDLFGAGKKTGDDIFSQLATSAEDLHKWLTSPDGQKALKDWFIDARILATEFGRIVTKVVEFMDALDTPQSRQSLMDLLWVIQQIIGALTWVVTVTGQVSGAFKEWGMSALVSVIGFFAGLPALWTNAVAGVDRMRTDIMSTFSGFGAFFSGIGSQIVTAWNGFWDQVILGAGRVGTGIMAAFSGIGGFFTGLGTQIVAAWNGFWNQVILGAGQVGTGIMAAFSTLGGFFSGLGTQIVTIWNGFWSSVIALAGTLPSLIIGFFQMIPAGISAVFTTVIGFFQNLYMQVVGGSIIPDMVMAIVGWFAQLPGMIVGVLGNLVGRFASWVAGIPGVMRTAVTSIANAFSGLATRIIARAGNIISGFAKWVAGIPAKMRATVTSVVGTAGGLASRIIARAGSLAAAFARWVSSLAGKARSTVASIIAGFANLAGRIISRAGSIASKFASYVAGLPGKAKTIAGQIASAFSGLAGKIISKAGDLAGKLAAWGRSAVSKAGGVASDIVSKFSGLARRIVDSIGDIIPRIKMPHIPVPTVVARVLTPKKAAGGIISGAQHVIVGEAGPEAIVPLNRALSRVDPAVRELSAIAQGLRTPRLASGATQATRTIDASGWQIVTPTTDPRAVASEVVNRMAAASYL